MHQPPAHGLAIAFYAGIALVTAMGLFYFVNSRPSDRSGLPPPDLAALFPANPAGWSSKSSDNLYQFSDILQTKNLTERTYVRTAPDGKVTQLTVYIAYWGPGQASVSRVASHTPDACWPGNGWISRPVEQKTQALDLDGRKIATGEHRFFQTVEGFPQNVWFWHVYDGRAINYQDPYSIPALFKLALKYGFRRQGDQVFFRVSSNRPWSELSQEPLVREIFSNLAPLGL